MTSTTVRGRGEGTQQPHDRESDTVASQRELCHRAGVEAEVLMEWDVYTDEAGGLPLRDSDDAFVAAAFAVQRRVP